MKNKIEINKTAAVCVCVCVWGGGGGGGGGGGANRLVNCGTCSHKVNPIS